MTESQGDWSWKTPLEVMWSNPPAQLLFVALPSMFWMPAETESWTHRCCWRELDLFWRHLAMVEECHTFFFFKWEYLPSPQCCALLPYFGLLRHKACAAAQGPRSRLGLDLVISFVMWCLWYNCKILYQKAKMSQTWLFSYNSNTFLY